MANVFISYAHEDSKRAAAIAKAIETRGWTVWWDPDLKHGESYSEVIERELAAARCVVVLWTNHSISSEWVQAEAADGAARKILVPAKFENVRLPLEFSRKHTADLMGWDLVTQSPELKRLLASVGSTLDKQAAETNPPVETDIPAKTDVPTASTAIPEPEPRWPTRWLWAAAGVLVIIVALAVSKPRQDAETTTTTVTDTVATNTTATDTTQGATPAGPSSFILYGDHVLRADRSVKARLEIDVLEGLARPNLLANTSAGPLSLAQVLGENGVDVSVDWGTIPKSAAGTDSSFSTEELKAAMKMYRAADRPGEWHLYVIVALSYSARNAHSIMFDDMRRGAAVFVKAAGYTDDPRAVMHGLLHEIGHELNLPHPFQAYGDTRSAMTYSYRWKNWSYDDPSVYRFDPIGQMHIRRGPEKYVRPGASKFFDYGVPQSQWTISGG